MEVVELKIGEEKKTNGLAVCLLIANCVVGAEELKKLSKVILTLKVP